MKYLLIMGGSGCGKTTLAMHLEEYYPEKYKRVRQYATRPKRVNEVDGYDYLFIDETEYAKKVPYMFEKIDQQFAPNKYGATYDQLEPDKWNVTIVALEAFFNMIPKVKETDTVVLLNILVDEELDIPEREGRNSHAEENINLGVMRNYAKGNESKFLYHEIRLSELKKYRNDISKLDEYIDVFLPEFALSTRIKAANTAEEIAEIIAEKDCKFGPDIEELIFYKCLALGIESSTVYVSAINKINNRKN